MDCVYYRSVLDNAFDSPVDNLEGWLTRRQNLQWKDLCPECFTAMQDLVGGVGGDRGGPGRWRGRWPGRLHGLLAWDGLRGAYAEAHTPWMRSPV